MTKKPYLVTIEEVSRRSVIIWADDSDGEGRAEAERIAEELANNGTINLDYDDFQERSCETQRVATDADMSYREKYDEDGKLL